MWDWYIKVKTWYSSIVIWLDHENMKNTKYHIDITIGLKNDLHWQCLCLFIPWTANNLSDQCNYIEEICMAPIISDSSSNLESLIYYTKSLHWTYCSFIVLFETGISTMIYVYAMHMPHTYPKVLLIWCRGKHLFLLHGSITCIIIYIV